MATATKQLEAIYQEISRTFSENSQVSVSVLDGDPPEKYEITYRITGVFKDDSGEIQEKDSHTITISIPFGFPHFPPSCKPKTAIFHPDFDPAAICIGDFWEKDRSIPDLINHIGRMISGEIYSTSNAFNEEALKWYRDNSERLPFSSLGTDGDDELVFDEAPAAQSDSDDMTALLGDEAGDTDFEDFSLEPADDKSGPAQKEADDLSAGDGDDNDIDTLDESFLDTDFDYLKTEEDTPEIEEVLPPTLERQETDSGPEIDLDRLKLMAKQKRFYELDKILKGLPEHQHFDERESLAAACAEALKQAREAYDEGTDFEHQGSPGRALESFKKTEEIVSDYPGLSEDIARTRQAKELLGDWAETPKKSETGFTADADDEDTEEQPSDEQPPATDSDVPGQAKEKSDSRTFFEETARQTSRLVPYVAAIIAVIAVIMSGAYYYLNSAQLQKARKTFAMCQSVLQQNRFAEAERQCETARDQAKQVQFFKVGDRDRLLEEINAVLNSQGLTEGLAGNLPLDGKYLPKDVVRTIIAFKHFAAAGDEHFAKEDWQQAAASYRQALELAETREGVEPELVFGVEQNLEIAEFRVLFRSGNEFIEREKWVLATQDLNKALEQVKDLNLENKAELIDTIAVKLAEIALATAREEGDTAFAAGRWKEALDHYKTALAAVRQSKSTGTAAAAEQLNQLIIKATLYDTINNGKEAFTSAEWDKAIDKYQQAIEILEANRDLLQQSNTDENRRKLARTMLQASVIRDKQEAARQLKEERYQEAITKLQSIIDTISKSDFKGEAEFSAVVSEARQAIEKAETDLLLADKIAYLEDNFIELFTKHYTADSPEALTEQTVLFEKRLNNKLLFRLECVEIGRGRPLKLVMKYLHDLTTGTWSFYSGND